MNLSLTPLTQALQTAFAAAGAGARQLVGVRRMLITAGVAAAGAWMLIEHPPVDSVPAGDIAVRTNQFSGDVTVLGEGSALKLPAVHVLRHFTLRDRVVRPAGGRKLRVRHRSSRSRGCRSASIWQCATRSIRPR